jgi:hypothetical protein
MSGHKMPLRKVALRSLAKGPVSRGSAPNLVRKLQRHRKKTHLWKDKFNYIPFQSQRNHQSRHIMNRISNQNIEMTSSNPITTSLMS